MTCKICWPLRFRSKKCLVSYGDAVSVNWFEWLDGMRNILVLSFYFLDVVLRLSYNDCVIWGFRGFFFVKVGALYWQTPFVFVCSTQTQIHNVSTATKWLDWSCCPPSQSCFSRPCALFSSVQHWPIMSAYGGVPCIQRFTGCDHCSSIMLNVPASAAIFFKSVRKCVEIFVQLIKYSFFFLLCPFCFSQ